MMRGIGRGVEVVHEVEVGGKDVRMYIMVLQHGVWEGFV